MYGSKVIAALKCLNKAKNTLFLYLKQYVIVYYDQIIPHLAGRVFSCSKNLISHSLSLNLQDFSAVLHFYSGLVLFRLKIKVNSESLSKRIPFLLGMRTVLENNGGFKFESLFEIQYL